MPYTSWAPRYFSLAQSFAFQGRLRRALARALEAASESGHRPLEFEFICDVLPGF